uniref:Fam-c protein n=1 Tax=Acyrthosiphon pisum TaxID=7029 RepID=C4WXQ2_ACYPI|nr:hypothetical protein [Acyrthosiphon pisum]
MDKHIIMLALCLMVYIIGNIDAVENDKGDNNASSSKQRNDNEIVQDKNKRYSMFRRSLKDQFICLVHCYESVNNSNYSELLTAFIQKYNPESNTEEIDLNN